MRIYNPRQTIYNRSSGIISVLLVLFLASDLIVLGGNGPRFKLVRKQLRKFLTVGRRKISARIRTHNLGVETEDHEDHIT